METVTVYFDYLCPYAKRGMELASLIEDDLGLEFQWQHYSLAQGNYKGDDGWQLWEDDLTEQDKAGGKGLLPFLASYAAKQQDDDYKNFRLSMFRAYHDDGKDYSLDQLLALAQAADLDLKQFEADLRSHEARAALEHDHEAALAKDISATPTFCFANGAAAYFRFKTVPQTPQEAAKFFGDYRHIIEAYPDLETIRRPYKRR